VNPSWQTPRIEEIHVQRSTPLSIFIGDRAIRKEGSFRNYFPTWDAAKAFCVRKAELEVENYKTSLARAHSALDVVRKLTQAVGEANHE
jgi:hypothetical protein